MRFQGLMLRTNVTLLPENWNINYGLGLKTRSSDPLARYIRRFWTYRRQAGSQSICVRELAIHSARSRVAGRNARLLQRQDAESEEARPSCRTEKEQRNAADFRDQATVFAAFASALARL